MTDTNRVKPLHAQAMSSSSSSSLPPPPPNPILSAFETFVSETPLVTRYALTTFTLSFILSAFIPLHLAIINIPYFTIFKFEFYRLILSNFLCASILNLMFGFLSFIDQGKRLEFSMGSTNFAAFLLSIGVGTNLLFTIITLFLYIVTGYQPYMMSQSGGFWQLIFGVIALECSFAPEGSKRRLFFIEVPTLYYPVALWGLFTLLTGAGGGLECIADLFSIAIGFAYGYGKLDFLKISIERRRRLEAGVLRSFTSRIGWVVGPARNDWVVLPPGTSPLISPSNSSSNRNSNDEEQGWAPSLIQTRESSIPTSTIGNKSSNIGRKLGSSSSGNAVNNTNTAGIATRRSNVTFNASSSEKQSARETLLAAAERRAVDKKRDVSEE